MEDNKKITVASLVSTIVESLWVGSPPAKVSPLAQDKAPGEPPADDGAPENVAVVSDEQRARLQATRKEARRTGDVDIMRKYVTSNDIFARSNLAENKQVTEEILGILVADAEQWVRQNVASNKNTTKAMLEVLAGDSRAAVRTAVAQNPNTPIPTLEKLMGDRLPFMAGYVFTNKSATPEMKLRILDSEYARIAMSLGLTVMKDRADARSRFLRDTTEPQSSRSPIAI